MKIGISTGGGDCPGLNAIIRAAVKAGLERGFEVWGIKDSFNGLMDRPYGVERLDYNRVADILHQGGTILGTTNAGNPFQVKDSPASSCDLSNKVLEAYQDLGWDAIIVIGGDGTQGIASQLYSLGINMIGVPKTIDNDLEACSQSVGFDTAVAIASEAADRLRSTAESHHRVMILEVMGRDAGYIALNSGLASGANCILLPEIPFDYDKIIEKIKFRQSLGRNFSVVVVAEGAFPKGSEAVYQAGPSGTKNLGGVGRHIADELYQRTKMETRVTVLGHTQRGGTPSPMDRILGSAYGVQAIEAVADKDFGKIVVFQDGRFRRVDYADVAGRYRPVDLKDPLVSAAESIGICLGR